jgi:tetratricopeptide (TPR) repeat protein
MADAELYKLNAGGYHLTNLLIHLVNTLLLFLLLSKLTGSVWKSGLVAALFAIHPLHVESVAWISERKDVLSTFFWLSAIWTYSNYTRTKSLSIYILTLVLFALGLMSKPMLVTLPVTLLILDWWPLNRVKTSNDWKQLIVEKLPMFAMSAASAVITIIAQQKGGAVKTFEQFPLYARVENAVNAYASYIGKMILPKGLVVFYPHPGLSLSLKQIVPAIVVLLVLTTISVIFRKNKPGLLAGWLWYVITLVPVIGLFQVGGQAMADRYTYVPLIGIFIMIAYGIPGILKSLKPPMSYAPAILAIILILPLAALTYRQASVWHDSETLFRHAIRFTKSNYTAENNLGVILIERGKIDEAIQHFKTALAVKPDYVDAHVSLAVAFMNKDKLDLAMPHLETAIKLSPNDTDVLNNYGAALAMQGRLKEALGYFKAAVKADPENPDANENLKRAEQLLSEK